MTSLSDLTAEAVIATLAEFDTMGRQAFLAKYGFSETKGLYVLRNGRRYDSKAVVGVAMGRLPSRKRLLPSDFSGGLASVVRVLRKLGFVIIDERPARNPRWAAEEIILVLDLYLAHGQLDNRDARVLDLSATLNKLSVHAERPDAERWRNPNGVALKLANLAHIDPSYPGRGMVAGSGLDKMVFHRLSPYPDFVRGLAASIRVGARVNLDFLQAFESRDAMDEAEFAPSTTVTSISIPVEEHRSVGKYGISAPSHSVLAERLEQPLVRRFCDFLSSAKYNTERIRYSLDNVDYYTDIVVPSVRLLVEAKYQIGRTEIRQAIGQIKDYDFMEAEARGVGFAAFLILLGRRPTESAIRYISREGIEAAWPINNGWSATENVKLRLELCSWV